MTLNNINSIRKDRGFTIVELLIVIVIIAILAAIIIVAYNGITNRAHASAAKQAAQNVVNKAEAYNAEEGSYPATFGALTSATSDKSYQLVSTAATLNTDVAAISAAPTIDKTIDFYECHDASNNQVGNRVGFWDYSASPQAVAFNTAGTTTGTGITCARVTS